MLNTGLICPLVYVIKEFDRHFLKTLAGRHGLTQAERKSIQDAWFLEDIKGLRDPVDNEPCRLRHDLVNELQRITGWSSLTNRLLSEAPAPKAIFGDLIFLDREASPSDLESAFSAKGTSK